jgi:hypothetical protein
VRAIVVLVALTAVATGIGGVFANAFYGDGCTALAGLAISLATLMLGLVLLAMGAMGAWRNR